MSPKISVDDRIASLYPFVNEAETPLPRSWSSQDKCSHIGLSQNNLRAHYKGVGKTHKDAASARASYPIPAGCGLYYFEVKVISKGRDGYIGVGLCAHGVNTSKLPGWEKDSYGYHADDGHSFCASAAGEAYGPTFTTGDIIGCGLNLINKTCFYTKNGVNLGIAFKDLIPNLYPTIGLQTPGEIVDVNFGQQDFVFDIEEMKKKLQASTLRIIENFPVSTDDGSWHATLQRIVSAYLVHHGYCATAETFAKSTGQSIAEELSSIRNRQRIQRLILSGRISEAIDAIQTLYPGLLDQNSDLFFKLKCRQFIEMVNGCDGEVKTYAHSPSRSLRNSPCASPSRSLSTNSNPPSSLVRNSQQNNSNMDITPSTSSENAGGSAPPLATNGVSNNTTTQQQYQNGAEEVTDMVVDDYAGNCHCPSTSTTDDAFAGTGDDLMDTSDDVTSNTHQTNTSNKPGLNTISVITNSSKAIDTGPSMRQLCGGNIYAIEKLLSFGKELRTLYKESKREAETKNNEANEKLMKEAFSLLAYNNPRESPVGYLLEPEQREEICSAVNSSILEAHKLPGQPALELSLAQIDNCLKMMGKNGLGACAMVNLKNFYCDSDTYS
ncbi:ran-binding protein 9-like [Clytia hemisphaerica]|uniref:Ran-binding protein 9 n=1 Tax=Clytia hemisphaerica TaxID=252671 RepID=A0A7M5UZL1_9CNID